LLLLHSDDNALNISVTSKLMNKLTENKHLLELL